MRLFEVILDLEDFTEGINAISLVGSPAIESNWVALSKTKEKIALKEIDSERQMLLGAVLIPNKPILRQDEQGEFHIYFSRETIQQALEMYAINGNHSQATVEHMNAINGTTVVETWIKEDETKDKSVLYGFDEPVGTWFAMMKVHDTDLWDNFVKNGVLKGFSIEGFFSKRFAEELSKKKIKSVVEEIKDIINAIED